MTAPAAGAPETDPAAGGAMSWRIERVATRDGRELYLERRDSTEPGRPTVVFEAGMGMSHHTWGAVVARVAPVVATAAYDRSGLGRSAADPGPRPLARLADDLVDVLDHLGDGPFVLVGHSWGGPIIRRAAESVPERIAGLVLVDVTDETCDLFFSRSTEVQTRLMLPLLPVVARTGALRRPIDRLAAMLPEPSASGMRRDDGTVAAARAQQAELRGHIADLRELLERPPALPDVPVTYVSGTSASRMEATRRPALLEAHRAAAAALPRGRFVGAERSSHHVPFTEPDLVAAEVLRIV
ncbi:alpha/beta fold hydrolase [Dermatobacter hominis]|uniref:alpha/beta fold hydrolase n=1 Tax=Dermatobacter hominis TaxID=2884263 RepID=UPI001D11E64C|nr:alpha/beta hydrolase [Dermatobacter hominis]UDY35606.1 alpha/beta hydrolase [Dermatobacter hominis]